MALISYQQTDTLPAFVYNAGCSGASTGASTSSADIDEAGTAGSTEDSCDPGNNTTAGVYAYALPPSEAPGVATWASGDWVVRIDNTTMDAGTQITEVWVCDRDTDGTPDTYTTVVSTTSPGHVRGETSADQGGPLVVTMNQASDHTPQSQTASVPFILVIANNNNAHGASDLGITPSQIIDTPIDDGLGAGDPEANLIGGKLLGGGLLTRGALVG